MNNNQELINFLNECTCSFTTIQKVTDILSDNNFAKLELNSKWNIKPNNNYFTTLSDSSIIAFKIPSNPKKMNIIISHSDTPSIKLKPNGIYETDNITQFNIMPYGGIINYSWLDHPLSLAGKITIEKNHQIEEKIIDTKKPEMIIPSVAIHLQTDANTNLNLNSENHLQPIIDINIKNMNIQKFLNEPNLLDYELYAYSAFTPITIGTKNDILISPRIDNITSVYASLKAFLKTTGNAITIFASFNHEEIGSLTKEGADSTFFKDTIKRLCTSLNIDYYSLISNSIMLSSDNTHASHPNYKEYNDLTGNISLGKGLAITFDKGTTTDLLLTSKWQKALSKNNIKYQYYTSRNDISGGSTISNIITKHLSIPCIEIGIGELAMHSSVEMCSIKDINYLFKAMQIFYLLT